MYGNHVRFLHCQYYGLNSPAKLAHFFLIFRKHILLVAKANFPLFLKKKKFRYWRRNASVSTIMVNKTAFSVLFAKSNCSVLKSKPPCEQSQTRYSKISKVWEK